MAIPDDLKKLLARPLGKIPSGVYLLTAAHDGQQQVMLASWVQQAAFDPPCISVAIGNDRAILEPIRQSGRFAISILPENDTTLMKRFARGTASHADPFADLPTVKTPNGLPAPASALAWLECDVVQMFSFDADHLIIIGKLTAAQLLNEGQPFTHIRGSGFHY